MALDLEKTRQREKRLLQRKAKLESDLSRLQKAARAAERKADSRRKIILGGVFIKAAREGLISEFAAREMVETLASDRDKAALADFDFGVSDSKSPGASVATDSAPLERRE